MPKEDLFTNHELSWLNDSGSDSDVVLSSRVRLARNFRQIPFPNRADFEQLAEVLRVAVTDFGGDFLDGKSRFDEQLLARVDPVIGQIIRIVHG